MALHPNCERFVRGLLANGLKISIDESRIERSTDFAELWEEISDLEEVRLYIYRDPGVYVGFIFLTPFEDEDFLNDHSDNDHMNALIAQIEASLD